MIQSTDLLHRRQRSCTSANVFFCVVTATFCDSPRIPRFCLWLHVVSPSFRRPWRVQEQILRGDPWQIQELVFRRSSTQTHGKGAPIPIVKLSTPKRLYYVRKCICSSFCRGGGRRHSRVAPQTLRNNLVSLPPKSSKGDIIKQARPCTRMYQPKVSIIMVGTARPSSHGSFISHALF